MDYADFIKTTVDTINALPAGGDALGQSYKGKLLKRHGTWVEFGVWTGTTLTQMVAERGQAKVWGFDSFKGLPESWVDRQGLGAFAVDQIPRIDNAQLVVGWFEDTLPAWKPVEPITFAHIDCDIYSATSCVLNHIVPMLADGAIVVFDELFNYPGFEDHEMKALYEAYDKGFRYEWIYNYGGPPGHPNERGALIVRK